jgi:hypothetical protein
MIVSTERSLLQILQGISASQSATLAAVQGHCASGNAVSALVNIDGLCAFTSYGSLWWSPFPFVIFEAG